MAISQLLRDDLSLVKRDGSRTDGLKGNVQKNKIIIHRSDIAIEKGDLLIRNMPHGGIEEYVVIEPNFRQGLGGIPAGYQVEVSWKEETTSDQLISPASLVLPESVISIVQSFISLCITIVNDDASNPQKHVTSYHSMRQDILELDNVITVPSWIRFSQTPAAVKNSVGVNIQGGSGAWERRRKYLQSEMQHMLTSFNDTSGAGDSVSKNKIITNEQFSGIKTMASEAALNIKRKVFIVHGHDDTLKMEVFIFLTQQGFEPIILHHEANEGQTILEKLEKHISSAAYAVVLYTACDQGKANKETELKSRARQNVVFEHGWLISKLSRKYVAAIVEDGVEIPGDLSGLIKIYKKDWKYDLLKELKVLSDQNS